jgi:thiol-disulfide isomerase/thioredoxin
MAQELSPQDLESIFNKNSVVLMYAPWCGHCQRFKQPFEEWAAKHPHVQFGQYNADAGHNDMNRAPPYIAENVQGFPTVFFNTANNGTYILQGPRDAALLNQLTTELYGA